MVRNHEISLRDLQGFVGGRVETLGLYAALFFSGADFQFLSFQYEVERYTG